MKKLTNMFAIAALSAASAAPALAQDASEADPFVSTQGGGMAITTTTGVVLGTTLLAFVLALSDSDSSSSSTTTSTSP